MSTPDQKPQDQSWDDYAELKIREAQQEGHFDALPGFGQPIPGIDEPHDEMWWVREKLKRERINHLPPSLAIKRDVELTLARISGLATEDEVRREVRDLNQRIREANLRSTWGPPSTQMPLEEERVVEQWTESCSSPPPRTSENESG